MEHTGLRVGHILHQSQTLSPRTELGMGAIKVAVGDHSETKESQLGEVGGWEDSKFPRYTIYCTLKYAILSKSESWIHTFSFTLHLSATELKLGTELPGVSHPSTG